MPDVDETFMRSAVAEARKAAELGEVPVGAVVVENGHIVGKAHNQVETLHDPTAHAEMIAITQASEHRGDWRLNGMTLYVTMEPCSMCAGAIILGRLDRLVFGATDPRAGAVGSLLNVFEKTPHIHKVKVTGGVMAEEGSTLLKDFFKKKRQQGE